MTKNSMFADGSHPSYPGPNLHLLAEKVQIYMRSHAGCWVLPGQDRTLVTTSGCTPSKRKSIFVICDTLSSSFLEFLRESLYALYRYGGLQSVSTKIPAAAGKVQG